MANIQENKQSTVWVNTARIIAALAVVAIHCSSTQIETNDAGLSAWLAGGIINSFSRWCVPVFVMISGALLLKPSREISISQFYLKRGVRLLIPCVFWILVYLAIRFIADYKGGRPHGPMIYVQAVLDGKVFFHTWYIFMLLGLYMVTPFLQKLLSVLNKKETFALLLVVWFLTIINDWLMGHHSNEFFMIWFLSYLGYYIMGYYMRYFVNISKRPVVWLACFILSSLLILYTRYNSYYLDMGVANPLWDAHYISPYVLLQSFFAMLFFISLEYRSERLNNIWAYIAPLTLGIYLAHPIVIYALDIVSKRVSINPWLHVIGMTLAVYFLTLVMVLIFKKIPLLKKVV